MLVFDDEKSRKKMFRMLLRNLIFGIFVGWLVLSIFIFTDVASLRTLIKVNHSEFVVYPLLFLFFAITFGSVGMGIGIMGSNKDDDDDDDKGLKINLFPSPSDLKPLRQTIQIRK